MGALLRLDYGNGDSVQYTYDEQGRVIKETYEDSDTVSYTYDAWGNPLNTVVHVSADDANYTKYSTIAELNPLRYRGYVYDVETGLYYLQSRYYNPEIGRFINTDGLITTGQGFVGNNLFSYCLNNPANYLDVTGCIPVFFVDKVETNESSNGKYKYSTTIHYSFYESNDPNGPWRALTASVTVVYDINASGVVLVDNDANPDIYSLPQVVSKALSEEMMHQAKKVKSDALTGRTATGISFEMFLHSLGNIFLFGKLKKSAEVSNMGSTEKNSMGYDSNALFFENPLMYLFSLVFGGD